MKTRRIQNAWDRQEWIRVSHAEDLYHEDVSGVYTSAGTGLCVNCAAYIDVEDITAYERPNHACITCENCGRGTYNLRGGTNNG